MELREWLIILGLVLVGTIVIDGFRRLQRQRRVPRLDRATGESGNDAESESDPEAAAREAEVNWELPNGGARVVRPATFERHDSEPVWPSEPKRQERIPDEALKQSILNRKARSSFADMQHNVKSAMRAGARRVTESAQRLSHRRDEEVDVRHEEPQLAHAEPAEIETPASAAPAPATPAIDEERLRITAVAPHDEWIPVQARTQTEAEAVAESAEPRAAEETPAPRPVTDRSEAPQPETASESVEPVTRSDVVTPHPAIERAKRHHVSAARARETLSHAEEVIVISVFARTEAGFDGADLLNLMLACGLRFSEMGIFHRYESEAEESELQFSMVNVVKPGVFDLDSMQEIVTPGVTFLMPLPGANDTAAAFEAMLETAMVLVRNLGGELKDENHSVMTAQTIEFARQRVQEFERRHRLHRYQAN
ncbi:cell division protein ZipA [Salinicola avicenniae]|uniref:cell division protein ZipA n=1 Tax=Salinicola avicenniae TaxID=2916836 RepID=UPI00207381C6|nr:MULTISPECIES: cell division protein ZipA [unclassified Salinicola]